MLFGVVGVMHRSRGIVGQASLNEKNVQIQSLGDQNHSPGWLQTGNKNRGTPPTSASGSV